MTQDQWKISLVGHRAVVTNPGGIDITTTGGLSQAVATALQAGAVEMIVDTTRVGHCSQSGTAALLRARRHAEAAGAALRVVAGPALRQAMAWTDPVTRALLTEISTSRR